MAHGGQGKLLFCKNIHFRSANFRSTHIGCLTQSPKPGRADRHHETVPRHRGNRRQQKHTKRDARRRFVLSGRATKESLTGSAPTNGSHQFVARDRCARTGSGRVEDASNQEFCQNRTTVDYCAFIIIFPMKRWWWAFWENFKHTALQPIPPINQYIYIYMQSIISCY